MEGDLWEFYRLDVRDVFAGALSPRRAWVFITRLMDEPMSRLRAEVNGKEWLGYSRHLQSLDDIYNLAGIHAQISAGEKRPKTDHFKEPPSTEQKAVATVASFNAKGLAAQINQ